MRKKINREIKKRSTKGLAWALIFCLAFVMLGQAQIANATAYLAGSMSDTMTNLNNGETADHSIRWELPTTITFDSATNIDTMRVDFPTSSGFTAGGTWTTADFTLAANDGGRALTVNAVDEVAGANLDCTVAAGVDNVCIAVDTTNLIFTIKPSADFTATTADTYFILTIDGTTANGTLTNPSAANSYAITMANCDETASCITSFTSSHSGSIAVSIEDEDTVTVTATVDPTITFTMSTNTIGLGTLSTGSVSSQTMTVQTATNSTGGYTTTVLENNDLRIDGSNNIDDVSVAGQINAGTEEYGMSSTDTGQEILNDADCASTFNADPITSTAQSVAGYAGGAPVDETITLCFAASIAGTTAAGAYTHTLTFISTATF